MWADRRRKPRSRHEVIAVSKPRPPSAAERMCASSGLATRPGGRATSRIMGAADPTSTDAGASTADSRAAPMVACASVTRDDEYSRTRAHPNSVSIRPRAWGAGRYERSEEHTSALQSLMRISYAVFCLKKKNNDTNTQSKHNTTH